MMTIQPLLPFAEVPITCPTQAKYHTIAPCLAEQVEPQQQAKLLNLSYSTVSKWLKQFREDGMPGLCRAGNFHREPYTAEKIIVSLIYFKCCVPKASSRELARVLTSSTGPKLHNETVKSLLVKWLQKVKIFHRILTVFRLREFFLSQLWRFASVVP